MKSKINLYDFDGVTSIGVTPRKGDIIITGRCIDEYKEVYTYLESIGILGDVIVYFNPILLETRGNHTEEARIYSGNHKANIINNLLTNGVDIGYYFEDDLLQADIVKQKTNLNSSKIIMIPQTVNL